MNTDRILTTHVGSRGRSRQVSDLTFAHERVSAVHAAKFDRVIGISVPFVAGVDREAPAFAGRSAMTGIIYVRPGALAKSAGIASEQPWRAA